MNIRQTTVALSLALAASAAPVLAQEIMTSPFGAIAADDAFVRDAVASNYAEVTEGKIAAGQARGSGVKQFAALMVDQHTGDIAKITSIANTLNVKYPDAATPADQAEAASLQATTRGFDRKYLADQVASHQKTIAIYKKEIASGTSAQLKTYAQNAMPELQSHLDFAQRLTTDPNAALPSPEPTNGQSTQ